MIVLFIITSCVLSATYAGAVEPDRHTHRHSAVRVHVKRSFVQVMRGESVAVRCRAKGGIGVDDIPYITFYKQINRDTSLPMSSGLPGVIIEADEHESVHHQFHKSVKTLHIHKEAHFLLDKGENVFFCKGTTLSGHSHQAKFVIYRH